jgi:hypothetical protein
MRTHESHPAGADAVAAFDTQDEADEAVLRLRIFGIPEDRIGYFNRTTQGAMVDIADRNHWFAGATIGTILGAVLGYALAWASGPWVGPLADPDTWGYPITVSCFAALFCGSIGAAIHRQTIAANLGQGPEPFVVAVAAGKDRDLAMAIMRGCGGREVSGGRSHESSPVMAPQGA